MNKKNLLLAALAALIAILGFELYLLVGSPELKAYYEKYRGRKTVSDIVGLYGEKVKNKLAGDFRRAGIDYPPDGITLVALKSEKILEVWSETGENRVLIKKYAILAASGKSGPKLVEGDCQVPEGIYRIEGLNPNSSYHLSLKINYPNEYDRQKALGDNRTNLGRDIFIHGRNASVGCLAIGDEAIEELFVLAAGAKKKDIKVVMAPYDMRRKNVAGLNTSGPPAVSWLPELYETISGEMSKYL